MVDRRRGLQNDTSRRLKSTIRRMERYDAILAGNDYSSVPRASNQWRVNRTRRSSEWDGMIKSDKYRHQVINPLTRPSIFPPLSIRTTPRRVVSAERFTARAEEHPANWLPHEVLGHLEPFLRYLLLLRQLAEFGREGRLQPSLQQRIRNLSSLRRRKHSRKQLRKRQLLRRSRRINPILR